MGNAPGASIVGNSAANSTPVPIAISRGFAMIGLVISTAAVSVATQTATEMPIARPKNNQSAKTRSAPMIGRLTGGLRWVWNVLEAAIDAVIMGALMRRGGRDAVTWCRRDRRTGARGWESHRRPIADRPR